MRIKSLQKEELSKKIFLQLLERSGAIDKKDAEALARTAVEIADSFMEATRVAFDAKPAPKSEPFREASC